MRFWLTVAIILIFDQVSKYLIITNMSLGQSIPVISGIINFTYIHNPGAAFGMLAGKSWVFYISAIIVISALTFYYLKYSTPFYAVIAMGLIVGGSIGNFIDRIRFDSVVDFIDLGWWPIFNIADIAIVVGGIVLIIYLFVERSEEEWN
ncbi:Lipoprotein signal peptidase [Candidatus Syntrophocurvum alkaliphilum]|uniref:Lipoprotein signal peptidase n=1 Tax=Candidatus Syntrophocurvum alkaliphilum TaxID=2293317 RepID=A0A6I6DHA2_9FIRM|nr:signal peptidase II [Candidatus Syntrophocurvum alkaliphilum]QGT99673.1 Lipoprotein signal peptidase [Candidatus Syntrophocurvum alkaliphilum]